MTKLEFMVRAFTLQNEQITAMAEEQRTLLASIIEERKNSDNTYSDIKSDGGLDPRTKYEAERFKRQWFGLTDEEVQECIRSADRMSGEFKRTSYWANFAVAIEEKIKTKNGY